MGYIRRQARNIASISNPEVKILASNKQLLFYEWHVQKASDEKCQNCWYTSAVSQPVDQGNTI